MRCQRSYFSSSISKRVDRRLRSCERRMIPSSLPVGHLSLGGTPSGGASVSGPRESTGKPLCLQPCSTRTMLPMVSTTLSDTTGRAMTSPAMVRSICHSGSWSRNLSFFLRSPISYTPSCPNMLPTNLAVHVVTTIGSRKCTFAVPSIMITTSEIVARCTPPSIAAAPASAYAPAKTLLSTCCFTSWPTSLPSEAPTSTLGMKSPAGSDNP
mmetsp:Transcript_17344/g.42389  ORF Transcript_17344/g.42389 Transcript_17344/m.42389 type:complete len:211 (+) Transcript_17344:845-1477(+)